MIHPLNSQIVLLKMLRIFLVSVLAPILSLTSEVWALSLLGKDQQMSPDEKTFLTADEVSHLQEEDLLTAEGRVEVHREGRILYADKITYHPNSQRMTATGHVRLKERNGSVIDLDHAALTGDLQVGVLEQVRLRLADQARLVAARADRRDGKITHFNHVVYSPCALCKENPRQSPFWQLKAKHVLMDENTEDITYTDVLLEMLGVPVLYTPYFRHPAPHVKRRTGLLSVLGGRTAELGWYSLIRYYWAISPDKDLTVMPLLRSNGHGMLALQYRQRFERGYLTFEGSIDPGDKVVDGTGKRLKESDRVRWHLAPEGRYDFTKNIRGGFHIERTSDQTYFHRYTQLGLSSQSFLTSRIYGEGFWGRNYGILQGYNFQGLRQGDRGINTPILFPWLTVDAFSQPDAWGGRWRLEGDGLALTRTNGTRYGRLSVIGGWQKTALSSWGDTYTYGARMRGDTYEIHNYPYSKTDLTQKFQGNVTRLFPQAYMNWAYALFQKIASYRVILEPRAGVVLAPHADQPKKLPNEDSHNIEFNDANVMNDSRFAGLDHIDGGSRFNYGVNVAGFSHKNSNGEFFIGQSIALQHPESYLASTGLDKRISDVVARLKYNYQDWFKARTRFLIDRRTWQFRRQESSLDLGKPWLKFSTDYIQLPPLSVDAQDLSDKQIRLTLSSLFHENWSASMTTTRDLGRKAGALSQGVGLTYTNDCFTFANTVTKTFYMDRDLRPGLTYMFRLTFKNLGDFSQSLGVIRPEPGTPVKAF